MQLNNKTNKHFGWPCSLVRCVLAWWKPVEAVWVLRKPSIRILPLILTSLSFKGPSSPGSNPFRRGWRYCLTPVAPLFRGMPSELKAFWGSPGVYGFRLCAQINLKIGLVPYSSGWWDVRLKKKRKKRAAGFIPWEEEVSIPLPVASYQSWGLRPYHQTKQLT